VFAASVEPFFDSIGLNRPSAEGRVGAPCRPLGSHCADWFGGVKVEAARCAGARSASLDATESINDLPATKSQLLIRLVRRQRWLYRYLRMETAQQLGCVKDQFRLSLERW